MSRIIPILYCTLSLAASSISVLSEDSLESKHSKQKTSAQLAKCPDGHADLKDIPIRYGLFGVHIRPEEQWTDADKELARQEAAKEIVLGGDVIFQESPRFQVTCLKCGYSYHVLMVPDEGAYWGKQGKSLSDFTTEFSEAARTLPFSKEPSVYLGVSLDRGKVNHEFVMVTVPLSRRDTLLDEIRAWIDEHHFDKRLLRIDPKDSSSVFKQPVEDGRAEFTLDVYTRSKEKDANFTFSLFRRLEK